MRSHTLFQIKWNCENITRPLAERLPPAVWQCLGNRVYETTREINDAQEPEEVDECAQVCKETDEEPEPTVKTHLMH